MKCNAMRFQDQAGALYFDFSTAEPSKSCCGQRKAREFSIDEYPKFSDTISTMRPLFSLPGRNYESPQGEEPIEIVAGNYAVQ